MLRRYNACTDTYFFYVSLLIKTNETAAILDCLDKNNWKYVNHKVENGPYIAGSKYKFIDMEIEVRL